MDNPLTPRKIKRLLHLAEDKSFDFPRRMQTNHGDVNSIATSQLSSTKTDTNYESSSGILDLDKVEGFGEGMDNISLSKSTTFNPGEMTGRSTGTDIVNFKSSSRAFEEYGKHSMALDSITSHMDKQTLEINDIMRHSIATNFSVNSKNLTADEASFIKNKAPLPIPQSAHVNIQDSMQLNSMSNMSVGSYFKHGCADFGSIFIHSDSPERPSITEVSSNITVDTPGVTNKTYKVDPYLDSIPVKQPKEVFQKPIATNLFPATNFHDKSLKAQGKLNQTNPKNAISKPTDILLRNLQSSHCFFTDDTTENSINISKIDDYLGKESNIRVSDVLQLNKKTKQDSRKYPLTELQLNILENQKSNEIVTLLKDTKNMETASSSGTANTVISLDKLKISEENLPAVVISRVSNEIGNENRICSVPSNSPSSKSRSTLSTVQEVRASDSFKAGDSPSNCRKGPLSPIPSPNVEYKELDKSVDWQEVFQQKHYQQQCLAKDQWVEIAVSAVNGFVGETIDVEIKLSTLSNSWLTGKIEFANIPIRKNLSIEMPRKPLLLSPGQTEKITIQVTCSKEMQTHLPFTMTFEDSSIDEAIEQKGRLDVNIKMPAIQVISSDGVNKVFFPPTQENSSLTKYFVLTSDCPIDLRLGLSIGEGESMFLIKTVQEIKKCDVTKALLEKLVVEDGPVKVKGKVNKHFCKLNSGNAIRVAVLFNAPKLSDLELVQKIASFKGTLNISLIGIDTVLKQVELFSTVGCTNLVVQSSSSKIQIPKETTTLTIHNTGTVSGVWLVKFKRNTRTETSFPFKVSTNKLDISPGTAVQLNVLYSGPQDVVTEGTLILEETATGKVTTIELVGGTETMKFPIKTNYNSMSWVRAGRKELSLKNFSDKKIQIRCQIVGDGFVMDAPGIETRGTFVLSFGPCECRPLQIVFAPKSSVPCVASLHLASDKNGEFTRKVKLHGFDGGEGLRWSGLLTYEGQTALVRAQSRAPLRLTLYNKSPVPVFLYATLKFNLQYTFAAAETRMCGSRHIVRRRSEHAVQVALPWGRLERLARDTGSTALATLTVITGPECTRQRILRIIRDQSTKELNTSLLPDELKILAESYEGESEYSDVDVQLEDFAETTASLSQLFEGLKELVANINLPEALGQDTTIVINDDTIVEHHTLCD